jgi:hypothetical protein
MSLLKKIIIGWLVLVALLLLAYTFLPWGRWFETQLRVQLANNGLDQLDFKVGDVGLSGLTLKELSLGEDSPFTLESLTLGYGISDLLEGKVNGIHTGELVFRHNGIEVKLGGVDLDLLPHVQDKPMQGNWEIRNVTITGLPLILPPLSGKGTIELAGSQLKMAGVFASTDASHKADFALDYPMDNADKAVLKIASAKLPWNEGVVSVKPLSIALYGNKPVKVTAVLDKVSLNTLMQQATGNKATASGVISGELPITIARSGAVTVQKGSLKTTDNGKISLPPDVIPGDHPQVEMVREVLKDFHYTDFSMAVNSDNPKKLSILLSLKGNNPEVYNGRMVNLNVNLSGDLIDLLHQGMITIVDPKQLLNKEQR